MASPARHQQPQLTPRQREVLDLLARGRTNPQIAESLGISLDGAKWHVSEVLSRLGVRGRLPPPRGYTLQFGGWLSRAES